MPVGQPSLARAGWLSARTVCSLGAPLMALLFVLFPRIGPSKACHVVDGISATGLVEHAWRMGSLTQVVQDDSIAMRLRFDVAWSLSPAQMYFRGPVLTRFDGVEWTPLGLPFAPASLPSRPPALETRSTPIGYEVTLEPLRLASVPLLEATTEVAPVEGYRVVARDDLQWLADRPLLERVRFRAEAHVQFTLGQPRREGDFQESFDVAVPRPNSADLRLARALRADPRSGSSATAFAQAVLQHIGSGGFSYTLAPGDYGRDGIDEFWSTARRASASTSPRPSR